MHSYTVYGEFYTDCGLGSGSLGGFCASSSLYPTVSRPKRTGALTFASCGCIAIFDCIIMLLTHRSFALALSLQGPYNPYTPSQSP